MTPASQEPPSPDTPAAGFQAPHDPVMLDRMVELLTPPIERHGADGTGACLLDGTLGAGGHSERFLQTFAGLRVVAIDRDPTALEIAAHRLAGFGDRIELHRARYDELGEVADVAGVVGFDAILLDLGVSSMQLDRADRGFAYSVDAPLDMRMDTGGELTAADVLNTYSHGELARVLSDYGEERFAGRIASAVLRERERAPFTTSARLVELLYQAIPAAARRTGGHPAKRTFQALRIEVNGELESLRRVLPAALEALAVGGRLAVMSYQSLEDRMVKREFADRIRSTAPPGLPVELPGTEARFRLITKGAEQADEAEQQRNPRSRPVRVRVIERIAAEPNVQEGSR